jgi:hypothetical protein
MEIIKIISIVLVSVMCFCLQLEREKLRAQMVMHYQETKSQEHQCILARHKIIEDRKEYLERLNTVRVGTVCATPL